MALKTYRDRNPRVLCDDTFDSGPQGWVQLMGSQYPEGVISLDSEITFDSSRHSLLLECADGAQDGVSNNWGSCTALKRVWRGNDAGIIECEWVWAYGSQYDTNSPRHVIFGLDTCHPSSSPRYFFQIRWLNYDSPTTTRVTKYQMLTPSNVWVDIPGAVIDHPWNENKRDLHRTQAQFNLSTGKYEGLRVDGIGFGSFADTPDTTMSAYGPSSQTLGSFKHGNNPFFSIANKSNTASNNHGWANLAAFKMTALYGGI